MGRIRTIKPEFFTSRSLSRVSRDARLTFAGLWCQADDCGRGVADVRILKGAIWPLDDDIGPDEITGHLEELLSTGHLVVYDVRGDLFYEVAQWPKHQAAAYTRGTAKHPAVTEGTLCTSLHASSFPVLQESAYKERTGQEPQTADVIAEALTAYVLSVCIQSKNTSQRFRDSVYDNAMRERGPVLRAALEADPNMSVDDLRELLGLGRLAPKVETGSPNNFDPNCEHCAGSGIRTVDFDRNTVGPCDCTASDATVLPLRRNG